ncbi:MAG: hypothetical protein JWQ74_3188 [Marmoricola sp.]|nr:hypothetical protein [Marmoricola sp.]
MTITSARTTSVAVATALAAGLLALLPAPQSSANQANQAKPGDTMTSPTDSSYTSVGLPNSPGSSMGIDGP